MQRLKGADAYENLHDGIKKRTFRYPTKKEAGYANGVLFPKLNPKFRLTQGEKVFTIGSCFAREIERKLIDKGFSLPVAQFATSRKEFPHAAPHLLNEYNAGTILQRIESVFGGFNYQDDMGVEESRNGFLDLFLHIHQKPITIDRLLQRRSEIKEIYKQLLESTTLVITLGLTETWFDSKHSCYLNKAPSKSMIAKEPERFYFHRMEVEDVSKRVFDAIQLINNHSEKKIILTVSPIPIEATFSKSNAIVANSYSKAVLRVVAELVCNKFVNVDYFPSYEMALSGGMNYFGEDNVHVTGAMVELIMKHMLDNYFPTGNEDSKDTPVTFNYIDNEIHNRVSS